MNRCLYTCQKFMMLVRIKNDHILYVLRKHTCFSLQPQPMSANSERGILPHTSLTPLCQCLPQWLPHRLPSPSAVIDSKGIRQTDFPSYSGTSSPGDSGLSEYSLADGYICTRWQKVNICPIDAERYLTYPIKKRYSLWYGHIFSYLQINCGRLQGRARTW